MPPNGEAPVLASMEIDRPNAPTGDGLKSYYITKIEDLQLTVSEKRQDVRVFRLREMN